MRAHSLLLGGLPLLLAACVSTPPAQVDANTPPQWQAALPHNGALGDLSSWWQRQHDPLLVELIGASQAASPDLAAARTRLQQARATRTGAGAALLPTLDAAASTVRSNQQSTLPMGTTSQAGLQASWEIDVFGGGRAARSGAQARLEGAQAGWHEARVSIAAEVANTYYGLRACEKLLQIARSEAVSRRESARLVELAANAGFQAPSYAGLARASAAEGNSRAIQQQALCDIDVKTLVALSAIPEPDLRARLAAQPGELLQSADLGIAGLPADTLAQRPDVYAAAREVAAASFDVGAARAQRYPRLGLSGAIGVARFHSGGADINTDTWTIGPLALSLPLFDGGRRSANVDLAIVRYEEAAIRYRATVRKAVREVEEALVNLQSTTARSEDARIAVEGYRASFTGAEGRYQNGLASLIELEDARRIRLAAETALVGLQRERTAAWIALYRAAGGGWREGAAAPATVAN